MTNAFKREWQAMKEGSPGSRFQARYAAAKLVRQKGGWRHHLFRVVSLLLAATAFIVGVVLAFIPGPAVLFFFIAGGLLAAESKWVARFLDWTELKLRAGWQWGRRRWRQLSGVAKMGLLGLVLAAGAGVAFGLYRVLAG